jgi:hypothetical protein
VTASFFSLYFRQCICWESHIAERFGDLGEGFGRFVMMHLADSHISERDDADQLSVLYDRQTADLVLGHNFGCLVDSHSWLTHNNIAGHYVFNGSGALAFFRQAANYDVTVCNHRSRHLSHRQRG